MKAVRLHAGNGLEGLVYEDAPRPRPGPGEVLIRVHAAAITPTELGWVPTRTTRAGGPRPSPVIPGHEFAGAVAEVGDRVAGVSAGDLLYGMNDWYGDGAQAEYCLARAADVAPRPRSVGPAAAAVVPISSLTAWQGLFDRCRLAAGERVLVHGAAGGVGVFAVQLARLRGARVVGTASARNAAFARDLGCDEVVDYHSARFEDAGGVDVVFDAVGGDTLDRSWAVLRPGGRLVTVAASVEGASDPRSRAAFFIVEPNRPQLVEVARLIDAGRLRPVVDAVFPLAEARRAYGHRPARGKVVLDAAGPG